MLSPLLVLLAAGPLLAASPAPATLSVVARPDGDKLAARWPDASGAKQALSATFPPGAIAAAEVLHFDQAALTVVLGERLTAWAAASAPGVSVVVQGTELTMKTARADSPAGAGDNAAALGQREILWAALLAEHHIGRVGPGQLQYDHARMAAEGAPALLPLAAALGPATDTRAFAERALALVQGIPAEPLTRDTFGTPLTVLRDQHGDCDEKSTLYAALIRAVAPDLPMAILTMKDHAIVGLGLPALAGDRTVTVGGTAWVVADPAGPYLHPVGRLGPRADLVQLTVRTVP
ncbi:MAG: hypothetical protein Q8P18_30565 [Pseudomonadota bacterium]|nr:hypothetical protein [Pseudomonadota bacterium]